MKMENKMSKQKAKIKERLFESLGGIMMQSICLEYWWLGRFKSTGLTLAWQSLSWAHLFAVRKTNVWNCSVSTKFARMYPLALHFLGKNFGVGILNVDDCSFFIDCFNLDAVGGSEHNSEGDCDNAEKFHCVDFVFFRKFVLIKNSKFWPLI